MAEGEPTGRVALISALDILVSNAGIASTGRSMVKTEPREMSGSVTGQRVQVGGGGMSR
jgi:NAD(P)-dependent dehydrogenase (short-subunit alcohol dehydrogenase family)